MQHKSCCVFLCAIQVALSIRIIDTMRNIICRRPGCDNLVKKGATSYCSQRCQFDFLYDEFIRKWKLGEIDGSSRNLDGPRSRVRRYLMESTGYTCSVCGWGERNPRTGRVPLHVDHIDGNARNNRPENLRLLCPNHHSLTETFGNANKGNGRALRRARYIKGIDGVHFSPLILPQRRGRFRARSGSAARRRLRAPLQ